MYINETNLNFGSLTYNNNPTRIVLHHAEASNCTIEDINNWHKSNGWAGVGYHYFVRKDGSIYKGRPEGAQGAHCPGANTNSIGICFEGCYMTESMNQIQYNSGLELISDIISRYGNIPIYGHRELYSTDCPGTNFPLDEFRNFTPSLSSTPSYEGDQITNGKNFVGSRCSELQEKLNRVGYNCGVVDGIFGSNTYIALTEFQRDHGLCSDGLAGEQTFAKLDNLIDAQNSGSDIGNHSTIIAKLQYECNKQGFSNQKVDGIPGEATLNGCPMLKPGSTGEITRCMQQLLMVKGYDLPNYGADGNYSEGGETYSAVIRFQNDNDLTTDSIIGTQSWSRLIY